MSVETVARRYATALADIVTKNGDAGGTQSELKLWETLINSSADLQSVFANPAIQQANKEKVLESLIARSQPTKTTANFLRVLLRNSRLTEIGEINEKFSSVLEERSGTLSASVTSARPLSESEKAELKMNLTKLTGKTVKLNFETDEALIGGVVTRVGSTVYDSSLKTQLEELKQQMIGN